MIQALVEEAPARLLAMMLTAGGCTDARAIERLDQCDAFSRIGIGRGRFVDLLGRTVDDFGGSLCECSWLRESDEACIDRLLEAIDDPRRRLLLCQLAAAVLGPNHSVSHNRRLVLEHALARWHIDPALITTVDGDPA